MEEPQDLVQRIIEQQELDLLTDQIVELLLKEGIPCNLNSVLALGLLFVDHLKSAGERLENVLEAVKVMWRVATPPSQEELKARKLN